VTVADASAEWLRYCEHERACKPSTLTDYRLTARRLVRDLGELRLEEVTPELLEGCGQCVFWWRRACCYHWWCELAEAC
jgi:hypothetical protein